MKVHMTGDDLYAEILMLRTVTEKTFLLLEGESDCNALDPHIRATSCETMPGYSKSAVLRAIEIVDSQGVAGVVGLVDRDWVGFCLPPYSTPNCFLTDRYDLDATIFFAGDLAQRLLTAHGEKTERKAYLSACGSPDVGDIAAAIVLPVGVLRLISCREVYGLKLRDFPVSETMSRDCTTVDAAAVVDIAYRRSDAVPAVSKAELLNAVNAEIALIEEAKDYCSGHDVARAMSSIIFRRLNVAISYSAVERAMRAMLNETELKLLRFYGDLKNWGDSRGLTIWKYG